MPHYKAAFIVISWCGLWRLTRNDCQSATMSKLMCLFLLFFCFQVASEHLDGQNQSVHLISLLSAFIEQKWGEHIKEEEDVLKFVLTWIPMVNYFHRFGEHMTFLIMHLLKDVV